MKPYYVFNPQTQRWLCEFPNDILGMSADFTRAVEFSDYDEARLHADAHEDLIVLTEADGTKPQPRKATS